MASGAGSTTSTIFDDVPRQPDILRITLTAKKSTMWTRFKKAMATLSPEELMKHLKETKDEIMMKLDGGEELTDEEIEFLNHSTEELLTKILDKFKKQALDTTKIERTDTTEEMKFKISVQTGLLDWLSKLFEWVVKKIKEIFAQIKEKIDWCPPWSGSRS